MKRLTLILCLLLFLTFSGCGSKQDDFSTLIAICSGKAQEYIDAGDYTAAIEVLEEGIAASDSEDLRAMLEAILAQTSKEAEEIEEPSEEPELILCRSCEAEMPVDAKFCPLCGASVESDPPTEVDPEPFDMTPYLGTWAADGSCYENGGVILTALSSNGELLLELSYIQSAPGCRVAFVQGSMPWDDVQGSSFTWDVDDDGWGNSADIVVDFYEDSVCVSVSNVVNTSGDSPFWGLDEGECWLLRSDTAWDAMQKPEQTYSDTYQYENQVTYDTSKASGILASLGMTEEEFRASCQPVSKLPIKEHLDVDDLRENPNLYKGTAFYFSDGAYTGAFGDLTFENIEGKGTTDDGYIYYEIYNDCILFDYRDDVYAPTVSLNDNVYFYMIFVGVKTIYSTDYVCFDVISLDKYSY